MKMSQKLTDITLRCAFIALTGWATYPVHVQAQEWVQWHSTNVQLLRGWEYKLGDAERTIVTLEHANAWKYGDFHMFTDIVRPDAGDTRFYVEATPRLSLSKMTGADFSYGLIKDLLISTMVEKPETQSARYLCGGAVDVNLPGFTYMKLNMFVRDNPDLEGSTHQFTVAWNRPFEVAGVTLLSEGFADFAGSEGATVAHELIVPRFLMDMGAVHDSLAGKLFMGVEWQYWHHKFGVDGVTESVPQLQFKWVL